MNLCYDCLDAALLRQQHIENIQLNSSSDEILQEKEISSNFKFLW